MDSLPLIPTSLNCLEDSLNFLKDVRLPDPVNNNSQDTELWKQQVAKKDADLFQSLGD